jgi:hypothetical protein
MKVGAQGVRARQRPLNGNVGVVRSRSRPNSSARRICSEWNMEEEEEEEGEGRAGQLCGYSS